MTNGIFNVRTPVNEPVLGYAPGSREKAALKDELKRLKQTVIEIPLLIGGREVKTNNIREIRIPHITPTSWPGIIWPARNWKWQRRQPGRRRKPDGAGLA